MNFVEGSSEVGAVESSLVAAAHELKAPLVLLRQLSFQIDDEKVASRVKLTSERALRLVDGLTKTARLEDGLFELAPVNVNRAVAESVCEVLPLAKARNIEISLPQNWRKLPVAVGNQDLLRAVLTNLIDNALNYTESRIDLGTKIKHQQLEITVRDYGEMISLKEFRDLEKNLGLRAQAIAARPLSSGLGLMIADQMSRAMHGSLSVARHRHGGLTFAINLPTVQQLSLLES